MEEELQSWLDSIIEESQFQWEYWKAQAPEDSDNWRSLLTASFQDTRSIIGRGILLAGGDSYSKQSVAVQILGLLTPQAYEGVFLDGVELTACGIAQAKKKLDRLLDHFYDKGTGLCLILDGLEDCVCRRELLRFLGQKLCEYRMYWDQLTPLFLVLMDDREQDIPALLRDSLRLCRLQLPNRERRGAYLANNAKSLRHYLPLDVFARVTEGVSYVQLQDLISLTECYVDSRDGQALSEAELEAFLLSQMPDSAPDQSMKNLCRSVQQLVDQLPQLLESAAVASSQNQQHCQQDTATQTQMQTASQSQSAVPSQEQIEKMPPRQLAVELFGEQAVADLQQMAQMNVQ